MALINFSCLCNTPSTATPLLLHHKLWILVQFYCWVYLLLKNSSELSALSISWPRALLLTGYLHLPPVGFLRKWVFCSAHCVSPPASLHSLQLSAMNTLTIKQEYEPWNTSHSCYSIQSIVTLIFLLLILRFEQGKIIFQRQCLQFNKFFQNWCIC